MVEKTIELTEEQMKRVEQLEARGITIGDAIDMLYDLEENLKNYSNTYIDNKIADAHVEKASLEAELKKIEDEIEIYRKLKDSSLDLNQKKEILEKEYSALDDSYEMKAQQFKRNISWANDFFKF